MADLQTLILTLEFLADLTRLSRDDQRRVLRALAKLDTNEHTPSLRIHELHGNAAGQWSAAASKSLRITFERLEQGRGKRILGCSHHYGD